MSAVVTSDSVQRYEEIFTRHAPLIYRTAYGITCSHEDAEDVLQAIFLALIQTESRADLARNPEAYFHRAAVNKSLNLLRTRRRWRLVDGDAALERAVPDVTQSDNELRYWQLYDAIAELNPDHAQILILRFMHGKTEAEIAKMFGVSRGTIAVKLFRSRARLRKLLRARLGEKS